MGFTVCCYVVVKCNRIMISVDLDELGCNGYLEMIQVSSVRAYYPGN